MQGSPFFRILYHFICALGIVVVSVLFSACGKKKGAKEKIKNLLAMIFKSYLQLIDLFYYKGFFWRSRGGGIGALLLLSLYCS